MRFWDDLRTAFTLAQRVNEVELGLKDLRSDWTDVEDKLLAREERLRKRLSRELKAQLDSPVVEQPVSPSHASSSTKQEIVRQFNVLRKQP